MISALVVSACAWPLGQTGGSYVLSVNNAVPITVASLDFGGSAGGLNQKFAPVTLTMAESSKDVGALAVACMTTRTLQSVAVMYSLNGKPQFEVKFGAALITNFMFPAVDRSTAPLADLTVVFLPSQELFRTFTGAQVRQVIHSWKSTGLVRRPSQHPKFVLDLAAFDTSVVQNVEPYQLKIVVMGGLIPKIESQALVLEVPATKGSAFMSAAQRRQVIPRGSITYSRMNGAGQLESINIAMNNIAVAGCEFIGNGSAPYLKVTLKPQTIGVTY